MNKRALLVITVVVTALLLCGFGFRMYARQSYIERVVPSSEMRALQARGEPFTLQLLQEQPLHAQGQTIYNLRYCPETQTLCCTLREPKIQSLGLRLLLTNGEERSGSYLPGEIRYGIVKAYFEQVDDPAQIQALDLINVGSPDSPERFTDYLRIPLT